MIAHIIPIRKLPRHTTLFDYVVPEELAPTLSVGDLVFVAFRKQTIPGIVHSISTSSKHKNLKPITRLAITQFIPNHTLETLLWFAEYYQLSYGTAADTLLPEPLKKTTKLEKLTIPKPLFPYTEPSKTLPTTSPGKGIHLILPNTAQETIDLVSSEIHAATNQNKQLVVYFPTVSILSSFLYALKQTIRTQIDCATSAISKSYYIDIWQRISKQESIILFATRRFGLLPLTQDAHIVVVDAENYSYKQTDLNPRYSLWELLKAQAKNHPTLKTTLVSFAPKIEHYSLAQAGHITVRDQQKPLSDIVIKDITTKDHDAPHYLISTELLQRLATSQAACIYLNRRGHDTVLKCTDCQWMAACPVCKQLLSVHRTNNSLVCHACSYTSEIPSTCPQCASVNIKGSGTGTHAVETILTKHLPGHTVLRMDRDQEEFAQPTKPFIILGTQHILHHGTPNNFDLVVMLHADLDLTAFDFRSTERLYQTIAHIKRLAQPHTPCIIQTHKPDHELWPLLHQPYHAFWKHELTSRKKYKYPPFVKIIKLLYTATDPERVHKEVGKMYTELSKHDLAQDSTLIPPRKAHPYKLHRKYYEYILIKYTKTYPTDLLNALSSDWLVDIDPEVF